MDKKHKVVETKPVLKQEENTALESTLEEKESWYNKKIATAQAIGDLQAIRALQFHKSLLK